jgi:hypothetical protein
MRVTILVFLRISTLLRMRFQPPGVRGGELNTIWPLMNADQRR